MRLFKAGIVIVTLCAALLLMLSSCGAPYDEEWIVGKTDREIAERYGSPIAHYTLDGGGTYSGWVAVYMIKEERPGLLGTQPQETLEIVFDTNDVAVECRHVLGTPGN